MTFSISAARSHGEGCAGDRQLHLDHGAIVTMSICDAGANKAQGVTFVNRTTKETNRSWQTVIHCARSNGVNPHSAQFIDA